MKKILMVFVIGFLFFAIGKTWASCEPDRTCTPNGTGCNYVCMEEVWVVGNMDNYKMME